MGARLMKGHDQRNREDYYDPEPLVREAELRIDLNNARKKVDQLEFFINREQGVWLETRDANQRLTKENEQLMALFDKIEAFLDCEGMSSTDEEVAEVISRFIKEASE